MRVAICEDNVGDAAELARLLEIEGHAGACCVYQSAEPLLDAYAMGTRYDLVFMDIEMPGINGYEAAQLIFDNYLSEFPVIIFLTVTDAYVHKAYHLGNDYLAKPVEIGSLSEALGRAAEKIAQRKIEVETSDGVVCLDLREVLFFEAHYGEVRVVAHERVFLTRAPLAELAEKVRGRPFAVTHRSYIVNLAHVKERCATSVRLAGGHEVPLSRGFRHGFREALKRFVKYATV